MLQILKTLFLQMSLQKYFQRWDFFNDCCKEGNTINILTAKFMKMGQFLRWKQPLFFKSFELLSWNDNVFTWKYEISFEVATGKFSSHHCSSILALKKFHVIIGYINIAIQVSIEYLFVLGLFFSNSKIRPWPNYYNHCENNPLSPKHHTLGLIRRDNST